jgi:leukotriene-A4 hydrolase
MSFNGWTNNLKPAVYEQFNPKHPFTRLIQEHKNVDPDVAFSCVPYEKGSAFLFYLEQLLGGSDIFEEYLRTYIKKFAYQSIDSFQWKDHLCEYFADKKDLLDTVDFDAWFYGLGMPPVKPVYDMTMAKACQDVYDQWANADEEAVNQMTSDDFDKLTPLQRIELLNQLWQHDAPLPLYKLDRLSELYHLNETGNNEILLNWIRLAIKARWEPIIELALKFVDSQGRMKYVRPIYRDLNGWSATKTKARDTFLKGRQYMHPITAEMIAKDLNLRNPTISVRF